MLIHPSFKETQENRTAQSWSGARSLAGLSQDLTIGTQILLRVLLCAASFGVGVGYSDRQQPELRAAANPQTFPQQFQAQLPADEPPLPPPPPTVRIKAVGDMVLGTNFPDNRLPPDPTIFFAQVQPLLQEADLVFGNYESTLTNHNGVAKDVSRRNTFAFRSPPAYSQLLRNAGFTVLSIANNHAFDFGSRGFEDTAAAIAQAGLQAVGRKGEIVYTPAGELTVAWIGFDYSSRLNSLLALGSAQSLVRAAQANADLVVVSMHGGAEGTGAIHTRNQTEYYFGENRGNLVLFSRRMIEAGADLVLGHGPHVPRALELYQGRLIAYSLGNFVGYRTLSTQAQLAYSLVLEVELDEDGDFIAGKIHPVRLDNRGIPAPSTQAESISLMRQLTQSDFPNTPLNIAPDGVITPEFAP